MKKKYNYLTPLKELPIKIQNEIYNYIKEGWDLYESSTGEKSPDRTTKNDIINNYLIQDIEEQYPVDTLIAELNKN